MHHPLRHAAPLLIFTLTFGFSPSLSFPSSSSSSSSQTHVVGINVDKLEALFAGQKTASVLTPNDAPTFDNEHLSGFDTHPFEESVDLPPKTSIVDAPPGEEHPLEVGNEATSLNPFPVGDQGFQEANQTSVDLSPSDHSSDDHHSDEGNQPSPSDHSLLDDHHLDEGNQTLPSDHSSDDHHSDEGNQPSPSDHSDHHLDEGDQTLPSDHSSDDHHSDEGSQPSPSDHSLLDDHHLDEGNQTLPSDHSSDDHHSDEGNQPSPSDLPLLDDHHLDEGNQTLPSDHSSDDHHSDEGNQETPSDLPLLDDHLFDEGIQASPSGHPPPDDHLFEADNQTSTSDHSSLDDHLFDVSSHTSDTDHLHEDDHIFDAGPQTVTFEPLPADYHPLDVVSQTSTLVTPSVTTPFEVSQSPTSDPTPVSNGLAIPGFSPGVSSGSSSECVCVQWWRCASTETGDDEGVPQEFPEPNKENFVATVDLRLTVHCPHMHICCDASNVIVEEPPIPPLYTPQCGRLNDNGVLFNVNGFTDNQAQFGQFPWMAALRTVRPRPDDPMYGYLGGGSLIHPGVVMTAAHKVYDRTSGDLVVRLGEWDFSASSEAIAYQEIGVRRVSCHPRFSLESLEFNVALLFLEREADLGLTVDTICLPQEDEEDVGGARCLSSGWGKDAFGQEGGYQEILKSVQLPLVRREDCESALRTTRLGPSFLLGRTAVCAGGEAGVDLCTGDGGSPLVCPSSKDPQRYVQVGISAWGIGCGQSGIPGVYASVTDSMPWIRAEMRASMPLDVRRPEGK